MIDHSSRAQSARSVASIPRMHVSLAAAMLIAVGCTEPTEPTKSLRSAPATAPSHAIAPVAMPTVTYTSPQNGVVEISSARVTSLDGVALENTITTVAAEGRVVIEVAGSYHILNVSDCDCLTTALFGWNALDNVNALPNNVVLPNVPATGQFSLTTVTPEFPGIYLMDAAQVPSIDYTSLLGGHPGFATGADTSNKNAVSIRVNVNNPTLIPQFKSGPNEYGWARGAALLWAIHDIAGAAHQIINGCGEQTFTQEGHVVSTCTVQTDSGPKTRKIEFGIDLTNPVLSNFGFTPAPNAAGWANGSVTAQWTCSDALSGPVSANPSKLIDGEGGNLGLIASCMDKAGNLVSEPHGVMIDRTPPTLSVTLPTTIHRNDVVTPTITATDALSGVASSSCDAIVTSASGQFSVQCRATDVAGNTTTKSVSYSVAYDFGGFQSSLDPSPTAFNSAKAGSAIDFVFSLGGNLGLSILAAGSPTATIIACPGQPPLPLGVPIPVNGPGLSFSNGRYTYTWKTDKALPGRCVTFSLTLKDGSAHSVNFQFK